MRTGRKKLRVLTVRVRICESLMLHLSHLKVPPPQTMVLPSSYRNLTGPNSRCLHLVHLLIQLFAIPGARIVGVAASNRGGFAAFSNCIGFNQSSFFAVLAPARPACFFAHMDTFDKFAPLSVAEERLLAECSGANRITFGDGERPETDAQDARLRAAVVRALLLQQGDVPRLHAKGLRLRGAWISGRLDLQGATLPYDLSLTQCHLSDPIELVNARLRGVHFSGCYMSGLSADNASFDGSFFLRAGSVVEGEISLAGARVSGDLQMCEAQIISPAQDAVFAPSLRVDGSLFLGNYPYSNGITALMTDGAIFMSSAMIGNDMFVTNCAIAPHSDLAIEPVFQGSEEHGPDIALSLARARVGGILYFKDNQISRGTVNLAGANAGRFKDELVGPGASYPIRLDGFTYDDFSRHTETGIRERLQWLERRPQDTPFTAQPYEQLARVLTLMGHRNDARTILMHKERLLRRENRRIIRARFGRGMRWAVQGGSDMIMRWAVGYGYRPARVLGLAVGLILLLGFFFQKTWDAGDMAPNAAPILVSKDWIAATQSHPENPGEYWAQPDQAGQDWETFHAYAYAADLVVPIVSLGQESAWAPSTSRSDWGRAGWWIRWFAKALGWIITALGAAAVTGAVRQD